MTKDSFGKQQEHGVANTYMPSSDAGKQKIQERTSKTSGNNGSLNQANEARTSTIEDYTGTAKTMRNSPEL